MSPPLLEQPPLLYGDIVEARFGAPRLSAWFQVVQNDINSFGALTRDPDPNHIDPQYARTHSPFGGTIAFGFQSLSMLTYLAKSANAVPVDASHVVNYGFDTVRFITPVPADAFVRGEFGLAKCVERAPRQIRVTYSVRLLLRGSEKPALAADWLALFEAPQ